MQLEHPQCQIKHIQPYFLSSPTGHSVLQNKKPSVLSWHHTFDNVQLQTHSNKYWGQRMLLSSRLLSKWWSDWLRSCQQKFVTQTKRWSSINTQDRFLMVAEISNRTKQLRSDKSLQKLKIVQFTEESIHWAWINRVPKGPRVPAKVSEAFCAQTTVKSSARVQELEDLWNNDQKKQPRFKEDSLRNNYW